MGGNSAEGHGATIAEATQEALGLLGVDAESASIEVLSEGRKGLFGGGRRAHVRARALDHNETDTPAGGETPAGPAESANPEAQEQEEAVTDTQTQQRDTEVQESRAANLEELTAEEWVTLLDQEADLAADFVEGLLDRLDLPGDIEIEVGEQQAFVTVQDVGSGLLIGRRGATLDALQELVRCAIQRQTERRSHVRVDVEGYRARQLEKLRDKCREAIAQVRESDQPVRLEPMDAYERKLMHDLVAKTGGVTSSSEGNEPRRRVVIHPSE